MPSKYTTESTATNFNRRVLVGIISLLLRVFRVKEHFEKNVVLK